MRNEINTGIVATVNTKWFDFVQTLAITIQKKDSSKMSNMELEIQEQPDILAALTKRYVTPENYILINLPLNIKKVVLIASGSSYHCAYLASELLKDLAGCDAECVYASEFDYNPNLQVAKDTLFVFVSQSGETSDTLEALKIVSKKTDKTLCVTNNDDSTMWQLSNYKVHTFAGRENSIASTKAMSAQLYCLYLIVLKIMYSKSIGITSELSHLNNLPTLLENIISDTSDIKKVAKKLSTYDSINVLGVRSFYGLAKETALKIKETSYINTTAYPQGEFMHGHVAILNKKSAVISIIDKENEKLCIGNLQKIESDYKPYVVSISNYDVNPEINKYVKHNFSINADSKIFTLFGALVVSQLLALEIAKTLKRNIDRPKGLKKVVIN